MKDFENVAPPPRVGLSLCAGGGGLDLGTELACPGFTTAVCVEWEEYPRAVLQAGQEAGYMRPAPIWGDLTEFSGRPWRGIVDTVLAGYPCQPFSAAGQRKGENDERHLWPHVARIIDECRPRWVILENVAGHISLGLETVLRELWDLGFTPATGLFSAGETGAAHERQRVFIVAYRAGEVSAGLRVGAPPELTISGKRGINELADTDGRDARAEREQRSGEQRFQPEGRGTGGGDVENARRAEWWESDAEGHDVDRTQAGRNQGPSRLGKSGETVEDAERAGVGDRRPQAGQQRRDTLERRGASLRPGDGKAGTDRTAANGGQLDHAPSARRNHERRRSEADSEGGERLSGAGRGELVNPSWIGRGEGRPEPELRRGRDTAGIANGELADASGAGSQGRERSGSSGQRDGAAASGSTAELRRAFVHAPGPSDADAWRYILDVAPELAPAISLGDVKRACDHFAQMVEAGELAQQEAESRLRFAVDGMAARSRALRLLGNGVQPLQAGYAIRSLLAAHGVSGMDMATAGGERDGAANGAFLT